MASATPPYFKDGKGETGLLLGIRADKIQNGVKFHLFPDDPIIAFRPFKLNPDNYVVVRSMKDYRGEPTTQRR